MIAKPFSPLDRRRKASFTGAYDAIPSIVAAYGMRRLRRAYTGSLLRIRRSSDNAQQDIGYTGAGHLDTAAIATFIGGGSGYIVTWYDQSGNGYNATQATAASQPLYVASGQNGRPVARWDGTDDWLAGSGGFVGNQQYTVVFAADRSGAGNASEIIYMSGANSTGAGTGVGRRSGTNGSAIFEWGGGEAVDTTLSANWQITSGTRNATTLLLHTNGTQAGTAVSGAINLVSAAFRIGSSIGSSLFLNGDISELIICNAALSTGNRQAAEAAANSYWAVY